MDSTLESESKSEKVPSPSVPREKKFDKFHVFMDLPNELIVKCMLYFGSRENIILSTLHPRLFSLCTSQSSLSLWKKVNIDRTIDTYDTIDLVMNNFMGIRTESLSISSIVNGSNRGYISSFPLSYINFLSIKTPNLVKLKLMGQKFEGNTPNLFLVLPITLRKLDLTHTFIDVSKYVNIPNEEQPIDIEQSDSYFKGIERNLAQLEVLKLDSCVWILPLDLIYIRRLQALKKLSMRGCRLSERRSRIFRDGLHYTEPISIKRIQWRRIFSAIQSGFPNLEVLDITNSDISRTGILNALFHNANIFPLRILKMGYYDFDYVWALLGSTIQLSGLVSANNLEILDVSGFCLEIQPGVVVTSAHQLDIKIKTNISSLKEILFHFCGMTDHQEIFYPKRKASASCSADALSECIETKKSKLSQASS